MTKIYLPWDRVYIWNNDILTLPFLRTIFYDNFKPSYTEKNSKRCFLSRLGFEILTKANIILVLKDGFCHWNFRLKYYAWVINEVKII